MNAAIARLGRAWRWLEDLLADDDPLEPHVDPVHLAGTLVACMAAIGGLYWLLWTLLVFEGGLFPKIGAGLSVLLTSKTLADYGCAGRPGSMGVFEGWVGNAAALVLLVLALAALHRLYARAAAKK